MDLRDYKAEGNNYYNRKKFQEAIDAYYTCINTCQNEPQTLKSCYHNIALCQFNLNRHQLCVGACLQALKIDKTYFKAAHRLLQAGIALKCPITQYIGATRFLMHADDSVTTKEKEDALKLQRIANQQVHKTEICRLNPHVAKIMGPQPQKRLVSPSWEDILLELRINAKTGTNEAYKYISDAPEHQKAKLYAILNQIKQRNIINQTPREAMDEQREEQSENLFADSIEENPIRAQMKSIESHPHAEQPSEEDLFNSFFGKLLMDSVQIFNTSHEQLMKMLNSPISSVYKATLLRMFMSRIPRFKVITLGFSAADRLALKQKLSSLNMSQFHTAFNLQKK